MMVTVETPRCVVCKATGELQVPHDGWLNWTAGVDVQAAFPTLDADQRELLITGTHAQCWERLFGGGDE